MANYGVPGIPNFAEAIIGGYEGGVRQRERSRLAELDQRGRELTGRALAGDAQAERELGGVNPEAYMKVKSFTQEQKKQALGEFLSAAYSAKDPQSWKAVVDRFRAQGHQFDPGEDAFENRDNLIRQGMSVADQMGFDWQKAQADRAQANTDRTFFAQQKNADRGYALDQQQFEETKRMHDAQINSSPKAPAGYRYKADGSLEFIQGGPADPRVKASQGAGGITTKMHNDAVAVDQAYRNLDTALSDYQNLVTKTGVSMVPGQENDQIIQARTNLQLQLKELYNLGVLNGPDLSLMQNMIFDPQTNVFDPIGSASKIMGAAGEMGVPYMPASVPQRAKASIGKLRDMLRTIRDNKTKGILDENGRFMGAQSGQGYAQPEDSQQGANPPANADALIEQANDAILRGADPQAVQQRLREQGIEADFAN